MYVITAFRLYVTLLCAALLLTLSLAGPATAEESHLTPLGPGDSVGMTIFGQPEDTTLYVGDDGTLNVPLAGPVKVGGMSAVDAARQVEKALKDGGFYVDPHVTLMLRDSRSQLVSVLGEVGVPGRYPVSPRTTIVELLAQAGGVKDSGSDVIFVLRPDASGQETRYTVSLSGLADVKNPLPTQGLRGGDQLVVPHAEHFYVYGEVTTPGTYRLDPGMTVVRAVARAGGITPRGSESRIVLKRVVKDGSYVNIHPKPGDLVQPEDIIRVKESLF